MDQNSRRIIDRLKESARADARTMGTSYAQRLDAHARAIAYQGWEGLQQALRADGALEGGAQLVAAMRVGSRTIHVDAECAVAMQEEGADPDAAYADLMRRSIDVAAVAEAIGRPRGPDAMQDHKLRRDVLLRAFWRRPGGSDRAAQATAELVAALAFLMSDRGLHDELHAAGVLPLLWVGRTPDVHMLRDGVMLVSQTPFGSAAAQVGEPRYTDHWWDAVADAIERHLPTGVSGWLRGVLGGTGTCTHAGCGGGGHGHTHQADHSENGRLGTTAMAFERLDHVCDLVARPAGPDEALAARVRAEFETTIARRRTQRLGAAAGDQTEAARQLVDAFLAENGKTFGDPCWPWDATMARRLADMQMDHDAETTDA